LSRFAGPMYDVLTEGDAQHTLMMGKGRKFAFGSSGIVQRTRVRKAVWQYLHDYGRPDNDVTKPWLREVTEPTTGAVSHVPNGVLLDGVLSSNVKGKSVLMFDRAEVSEVRLTGTQYGRTRKRVNCFVAIRYPGDGWLMAKVMCFIKVPHPNANVPPLRLALCNFYAPATVETLKRGLGGRGGRGRGRGPPADVPCCPYLLSIDMGVAKEEFYAVDPPTIGHKLVVAFNGADNVYGVRYVNLTSRN
jgi:hypothetical protein